MPKKPPRNAFYFFMVNFKEEQRKKGVNYGNMAEVAEAAGPIWKDAPPHIRAKFEGIAKDEKKKHNVLDQKYTSHGVPLSVIKNQMQEVKDSEDTQRKDINNFVKLKAFNKSILEEDIYVMDVNYFCKAGHYYLIGESTVLRFNLREGIKDHYHEQINPGRIPMGYASDVRLGRDEYGLIGPDDTVKPSNYMQILANIIDYLKQQDGRVKTLPPLFTMPDKVEPVKDFIMQMCSVAGEDETLFRVYNLDLLFFTLINHIKNSSVEGFPKESLALLQLKKDPFKYNPKLGCEHHEETDKSVECTTSRTKRWAFTVLDSCCPVVGIDVTPGKHLPLDYDLDGILTHKELRKEGYGPSSIGFNEASSFSTTYDCTFNDTASFAHSSYSASFEGPRKEKRVHEPMRMPEINYSKILVAPELTETEFPPLMASAGRGRGRGSLSSSLGKMRLED